MLATVGRSVFPVRYTVHEEPYDKCEENLRHKEKQGRGVTSHSLTLTVIVYMLYVYTFLKINNGHNCTFSVLYKDKNRPLSSFVLWMI